MEKVIIIVPAYNEQDRISIMLTQYTSYFKTYTKEKKQYDVTFLVVLNGCTDNTYNIVSEIQKKEPVIHILNLAKPGKGLAIRMGFHYALQKKADLIGFVDADMSTPPASFYELIHRINKYDGVIASRYTPTSSVTPPRPFIKRWGSKIFYEPLVRLLLGLSYYDLQCGAKLFTHLAIEKITPSLRLNDWATDTEILYLCAQNHLNIKEIPTTWHDQLGSKLHTISSGLRMLKNIFYIWYIHKKQKQHQNPTEK